ncbi:hypothetical protein ABG768_002090, partial [Culter alburnus]
MFSQAQITPEDPRKFLFTCLSDIKQKHVPHSDIQQKSLTECGRFNGAALELMMVQ